MRKLLFISLFCFSLLILTLVSFRHSTSQEKNSKELLAQNISEHPYWEMLDNNYDSLPKPERPDLAEYQDFLLTMDPALGTVPQERMYEALEAMDQSAATEANYTENSVFMNWKPRGPNNVPGRVRALMWDPNDPNDDKVWAGGTNGGLWFNNDINHPILSYWSKVDDFWDNLSVSCMAYDPTNTQIMYVGTGEGWYRDELTRRRGAGIWKTTDGGANWNRLTSTYIGTDSIFHYINDIAVHPVTGDVYAGTRYGGLRRSQNGGTTWQKVFGNGFTTTRRGVTDIEIASDNDIYVAIGYQNNNLEDNRIYRSTSGNPFSWFNRSIPGTRNGRTTLASAKTDPDRIYAFVADTTDGTVRGIFRTTNGGSSWTTTVLPTGDNNNVGDISNGQAWIHQAIEVDPNDHTNVYIASVELYFSSNSGGSWLQLSEWLPSLIVPPEKTVYIHADMHQIKFNDGTSNEVAIATDGGVFYSDNINSYPSAVWDGDVTPISLWHNTTQFYSGDIHPAAGSNYMIGGAQDNGSWQMNSIVATNATAILGGDGVRAFIDDDTPANQIASTQNGKYWRTTDSWASRTNMLSNETGYFISPGDYDSQTDTYIMPWGSTQLYIQQNIFSAPPPLPFARGLAAGLSNRVSHVRVSPASPTSPSQTRVYVGTADGRLILVNDVQSSTSPFPSVDITPPGFPAGAISCIEIYDKVKSTSPDDTLLVTFSNYGVSSVWITTDGGTTWDEREDNLPDVPIRWALINPHNFDEVILATEIGLWSTKSFNGLFQNWTPSDSGLANVRIDQLVHRPSDNTVAAFTHGRGVFTSKFTETVEYAFEEEIYEVYEGTMISSDGCRNYRMIDLPVQMGASLETDAWLVLYKNGTATEGKDYEIMDEGPWLLPAGTSTGPTIQIRVYEDSEVENEEYLELVLDDVGYANTKLHPTLFKTRLKLFDNDLEPEFHKATTLFTENWNSSNSSFPGWTISGATSNLTVGTPTQTIPFGGFGFAGGVKYNPVVTNQLAYILSPVIDATGHDKVMLTYLLQIDNYNDDGLCSAFIQYKKTSTGSWNTLVIHDNSEIEGNENRNYFRIYRELQNMGGEQFQIRLGFYLGNSNAIDRIWFENIFIAGHSFENPALYTSDSYEEELGPNQTLNFYDASSKRIIATIENLTSHNYGCTEVKLDRSGTGAISWGYNQSTPAGVFRKNYKITPTNNNPSGSYKVRFYYTEDEVSAWETATGNNRNQLNLVKAPVSITANNWLNAGYGLTPTRGTFGNNYYVEARFNNGFSGFTASIDGFAGPLNQSFPVEWLDFTATYEDGKTRLDWITASELNNSHFEITRGVDGKIFHKIGETPGEGTTNDIASYQYWDETVNQYPAKEVFYQLRQVDFDGQVNLSSIVSVFPDQGKQDIRLLGPNPFNDHLNFNVVGLIAPEELKITMIDIRGKTIAPNWELNGNKLEINNLNTLAKGVYIINIKGPVIQKTLKVIKN